MRNKNVVFITQAAMIAAIYYVLTWVSASFNLASGSVQMRLSEALCILPFFTPAAIPGLTIGCLIANLTTGYLLRKHEFLCTLPPVIANMLIVPAVLIFAYKIPAVIYAGVNVTYLFTAVTVGIGEVITICVIGSILLKILKRYRSVLFPIAQK